MIRQLFLSMLEVSVTTGVAILIIKVLTIYIKKNYSAKWIKWIWLMIAVRLMIPITLSPFRAPLQLNVTNTDSASNSSYTASKYINTDTVDIVEKEGVKDTENNTRISNYKPMIQTGESLSKTMPWMDRILLVWGSGSFLFIMYHLIGYLYYRKQILRWSREAKEQRVYSIIAEVSEQLSIKKQLKVYVCDKIASPSLLGFIHPVLVISTDCYSDMELSFIVKHELTHHRLKDIWYKLFLVVVNAVHWFNPAVYLLRNEADIDLEVACDDEVIKSLSVEERRNYGETILSCIHQQKMRKVALTTGFNNTTKTLKNRLKNILSAGKKRNGLTIIFVSLILLVSIGASISFAGEKQKYGDANGFSWYGAVGLIPENTKLPDNLIENSEEWNEFLESDRTIALVAKIPEVDISVYGLKEDDTEEGTYTLHGICVKQGNEVQVLDTSWGVYGELPKLQYQDYDGDGINELAMILRSVSGTDLSLNDLHILEKKKDGGWTDHSFTSFDWRSILNKRMAYQVKDGVLTITIDGKDTGYRIDIASLEDEWGESLTSVFFGSYGEFIFNDGRIYLKVLPTAEVGGWATPQMITEDYIQMEVLYNGEFELMNGFTSELITQEAPDNSAENKADAVLDIQSKNSYNIAESGSFQVDSDQILSLIIESNIKGGTVDLFLFDPDGNEQRITIGSKNMTEEIKLTKGLWAYNCSGIFKDGGTIHIIGTMKKEASSDAPKKKSETEAKEKEEDTTNNTVMDIQSKNSYNIAESGSFQVDSDQILSLSIESNIKGGTVDLFLFDPDGNEQRITIGAKDMTEDIKLTKGLWAYNCSGIFKDGGTLHIIGTIK